MRLLALASEYPPFYGGISTYAGEMAQAAHELGIDVTVAAPNYGTAHHASDEGSPFKIVRYPGGAHRAKDTFAKISLVRELVGKESYDVVHAMDWPFFLPVALSARSGKRIYTICGTEVISMSRWHKRLALWASRSFTGNCEVIAISEFTKSLFLDRFLAATDSRVRHELLGVSDYWCESLDRDRAEQSLDLPDDKFVIVTVARLVPRKNQLGLIQALNQLPKDQRDKICLLIIGPSIDAQYSKEVADAAAESEVDIRLLGTVEKNTLRRIYRASDLFCLLGRNVPGGPVEGFGLVFLEAGGQGLPSLASDVGAVKEVVLNDYNGIIIPSDDQAAFSRSLSGMMASPLMLGKLSTNARQRSSDLSWRRCAASTYRVADPATSFR